MKKLRVKAEDLFNEKLLSIVENDLKNGIAFTIAFADGTEKEIKDVEDFQIFLNERKL